VSESDELDDIVSAWRRERPDLGEDALSAMGTLGRFAVVYALGTRAVEEVFTRHGLRRGEFDVLAALRRSGVPYTLSPSVLADGLMLTRAGMTSRLDRLEAAGLVERSLDPDDRRSFRARLTPRGLEVADAAVTDHAANEAQLLAALAPADRADLDRLLRTLLTAARTPADPAAPRGPAPEGPAAPRTPAPEGHR
jgi:DNA-binding MarR family transcriptional regulator